MARPFTITRENLAPLLMRRGPVSASEMAAALGVNRTTIVRGLSVFGDDLVSMGATRRARYALRRQIANAGSNWPIYQIDETGRARPWARVEALQQRRWRILWEGTPPAWAAEFSDQEGVWNGYPLFLGDVRPQGFLGQAIARRVSLSHTVPEDSRTWSDEHIMIYLQAAGEDLPGSLVVGDECLRRALEHAVYQREAFVTPISERAIRYPSAALHIAETAPGSSAGGEQPKFLTSVRNETGELHPVLVKFSPPLDQPASQRWGDLLLCEYYAHQVLAEHGLAMPGAEILDAANRRFLEVPRFDRVGAGGRRGVISLNALQDSAVGSGERNWPLAAMDLQRLGLVDAAGIGTIRHLHAFGELIGNTDMHTANLSFWMENNVPFRVAPAYDMLPMLWAPGPQGEITERNFAPAPPLPVALEAWRNAAGWAVEFWSRVLGDSRLSPAFRDIANGAQAVLRKLRGYVG